MTVWNQDVWLKAWNFASVVHKGQLVPGGDIPYINHLGLVVMEAAAALAAADNVQDADLLVQCALLHDVLDDNAIEYEEFKQRFGTAVADSVLALTKDDTLPSKAEQMLDSLARIKQQPGAVWMAKLCDRISNLQPTAATVLE